MLGHSTSISLENKYWEILDEISKKENVIRGVIISKIYQEAIDSGVEIINFSSILRTVCVMYLECNQKSDLFPDE
ncbi:ribbon-helix-helix domain-containing protein [Vibrio lentus]|uniref:ribbon-helix-helix domain-containing protein n=1 Tax=Vibrio lentus TaxID=136468 RepID=UPI003D0D0C80